MLVLAAHMLKTPARHFPFPFGQMPSKCGMRYILKGFSGMQKIQKFLKILSELRTLREMVAAGERRKYVD